MLASVEDRWAWTPRRKGEVAGVPVGHRPDVDADLGVGRQPRRELPDDELRVERLGRQRRLPLGQDVPAGDRVDDLAPPGVVRPGFEQRQQRVQGLGGIAGQTDVDGVPVAQVAGVQVDLDGAPGRWSRR
jgi:hypothetical protein